MKSCSVHSSITQFCVFAHFVSCNKILYIFSGSLVFHFLRLLDASTESVRRWKTLYYTSERRRREMQALILLLRISHSAFCADTVLTEKSFIRCIFSIFSCFWKGFGYENTYRQHRRMLPVLVAYSNPCSPCTHRHSDMCSYPVTPAFFPATFDEILLHLSTTAPKSQLSTQIHFKHK